MLSMERCARFHARKRLRTRVSVDGSNIMNTDFLFVGLILLFFAVSLGLVKLCHLLRGDK